MAMLSFLQGIVNVKKKKWLAINERKKERLLQWEKMFQKLNLIYKACVFRLTKQEKPNGGKKN